MLNHRQNQPTTPRLALNIFFICSSSNRKHINHSSKFVPSLNEIVEINKLKKQIQEMKHKMEFTNYQEFEALVQAYKDETIRLRNIIMGGGSETNEEKDSNSEVDCLKEQIIMRDAYIEKLLRENKILKEKISRTELIMQSMKKESLTSNRNRQAVSFSFTPSNNETQNLKLRIEQKENKINYLQKARKSEQPMISEIQPLIVTQINLNFIFYKLRYHLTRNFIPFENFWRELNADKFVETRVTKFKLKHNFIRSKYLENVLEGNEIEEIIQYLTDNQIFVSKQILMTKLRMKLTDYEELFKILQSNNLSAFTSKIKEQLVLFKGEMRQKLSNITNVEVSNVLEKLYQTQIFLQPYQKQLYEYAMIAVSYPTFDNIKIEQIIDPFYILQSSSQSLNNLDYGTNYSNDVTNF